MLLLTDVLLHGLSRHDWLRLRGYVSLFLLHWQMLQEIASQFQRRKKVLRLLRGLLQLCVAHHLLLWIVPVLLLGLPQSLSVRLEKAPVHVDPFAILRCVGIRPWLRHVQMLLARRKHHG